MMIDFSVPLDLRVTFSNQVYFRGAINKVYLYEITFNGEYLYEFSILDYPILYYVNEMSDYPDFFLFVWEGNSGVSLDIREVNRNAGVHTILPTSLNYSLSIAYKFINIQF